MLTFPQIHKNFWKHALDGVAETIEPASVNSRTTFYHIRHAPLYLGMLHGATAYGLMSSVKRGNNCRQTHS